MYDVSSPGYIGVRTLSHNPRSHTWWQLYADPASEGQRYRWLASDSFMANGSQPRDRRVMQSVGPFSLPVGDSVRVVVGLVAGAGLAGLRENADTMKALYDRGYLTGAGEDRSAQQSPRFGLDPLTPNPARNSAAITYQLGVGAKATLNIYGLDGRLVRCLSDGRSGPGRYRVTWNRLDGHGARVPSGVYFCRLKSGESLATRKLLLTD